MLVLAITIRGAAGAVVGCAIDAVAVGCAGALVGCAIDAVAVGSAGALVGWLAGACPHAAIRNAPISSITICRIRCIASSFNLNETLFQEMLYSTWVLIVKSVIFASITYFHMQK
jgi:hypothetical protein